MSLDRSKRNFQFQLTAQNGDYYCHLLHLQLRRRITGVYRLPVVVEHCAFSTAERDADGAAVALPSMFLEVAQRIAGEVNFAMLVNIDVVSIKYLTVSASCPVQIQFVDVAFGILAKIRSCS